MSSQKTVLITGARGNLAARLTPGLVEDYNLTCLDVHPAPGVIDADLSIYDESWVQRFAGMDVVLHFAANPINVSPWERAAANPLIGTNVLQACVARGVPRIAISSSNHTMSGYWDMPSANLFREWQTDVDSDAPPSEITSETPPRPGNPYGTMKFAEETVARSFHQRFGIQVVVVRIGCVLPGDNTPAAIRERNSDYIKPLWLHEEDALAFYRSVIEVEPLTFHIVNLTSANSGSPWSLDEARRLLGYEPKYDVTKE